MFNSFFVGRLHGRPFCCACEPRVSAKRSHPPEGVRAMRALVFAVALSAAFAVPVLAQTTPGTAPPSGAIESGAEKSSEHPPTGRVEQSVPPLKSGEPSSGATGGTGDQKAKHPPTGRMEDMVPPMKPGDQPSPGQSTTK